MDFRLFSTCCVFMVHLVTAVKGEQTSLDCRSDEKLEGGVCVKCPVCRPGEGLPEACGFGEGANQTCQPCPPNTYNDAPDGRRCLPCINCDMYNRDFHYKCRPTVNAECGPCAAGFFNSYKDVIDKSNLYPCTSCRLRPKEPECLNPDLRYKGTKHPKNQGKNKEAESRRDDQSKDMSTQRPVRQMQPITGSDVTSGQATTKSAADGPLHHNKIMTEQESFSPQQLTMNQNGNSPNRHTGSEVIVVAVAGSLVTLVLVLVALLLWKRKGLCSRRKTAANDSNANIVDTQQGPKSFQMQPLLHVSTESKRSGEASAQPLVETHLTGENDDSLNVNNGSSTDVQFPSKKYQIVSLPSLKESQADTDSTNRSGLPPYTEGALPHTNSDASLTSFSSSQAGALSFGGQSRLTRPPQERLEGEDQVEQNTPTVIFNGPTTLKINAQQIGHHQKINEIGGRAQAPMGEHNAAVAPPSSHFTVCSQPEPESSQRRLPTAFHPMTEGRNYSTDSL